MYGSLLEWTQLVAATIALAVQAGVWIDAYLDYCLVRRLPEARTSDHIVANGNLRGETLRIILSVTFFLAGVVAVSIAPPPGELPPQAKMKLTALLIGSIVLTAASLTTRADRKALLRLK